MKIRFGKNDVIDTKKLAEKDEQKPAEGGNEQQPAEGGKEQVPA